MNEELSPMEAWEELKGQIGNLHFFRLDLSGGLPQVTTMLIRDTGLFEIIDEALARLQLQDKLDNSIIFNGEVHKVVRQLQALQIIKECFDFNGFEEFIPNSKWYSSLSKQKLLREVICNDSGTVKTEAR